jgi:hypothetical protein
MNPERLLARWSRRKRAAATIDAPKSSEASPPADLEGEIANERGAGAERREGGGAGLPGAAVGAIDPPFDPLSVPPLESITADTDIRGFLAPGVPPELTRAALRLAWASDPKIRDFVGLADYDWDFNASGAMAGFGPLEMTDDLRRMAAQIIGRPVTQDQTAGTLSPASANVASAQSPAELELMAPSGSVGPNEAPVAEPAASCEADDAGHRHQDSGPAQFPLRNPESSQIIVRQSHGGALPK